MIENFNNLFFLILHILVTGLFGLFTYRTLFAPHGLVKEWNLDANSGYIIRALGCFIAPFFLIGVYLLFRSAGPEGAWLYYNLVFLLGLFLTIYDTSYYLKLLDKELTATNSITDLIINIFTLVASIVLILGLSDKIYIYSW